MERDAIIQRWYREQSPTPQPAAQPKLRSQRNRARRTAWAYPYRSTFHSCHGDTVWHGGTRLTGTAMGSRESTGSNNWPTGRPTCRREGRYPRGNRSTTSATVPTAYSRPISTREPIRTTVTTQGYSATPHGCTTRGCSRCRQVISRTSCGSA